MSILIKGMKMPNNCGACPLRLAWCRERLYMATRPPRCPLTELPDHGDLIDKNRMIDVLHHGNKCVSEIQKDAKDEASISYCQGVMIGYTNSIVALDGAPVVIPAERSEE